MSVKESVVNLIFPRRCPVCGEIVQPEGALICPACIPKLSPVRQPTCKKCGKELFSEADEYCPDCLRHRRTFDCGVALLNYNEATAASVAAVKYRNRREYLDFYAEAIVRRYGKWLSRQKADALIPVPVHPARRRKRGFNQAEELAKRIGALTGLPVQADLLIRTRKTAPQKELNPAERLANLNRAFAVDPSYRGGNASRMPRRVILVDDIYTTGSTVEACARALKDAGAQYVSFVAICISYMR